MTDDAQTDDAQTDDAQTDARALLKLFHEQVRLQARDAAPGHVVERDGPVSRNHPEDPEQDGAMVESPRGLGATPEEADRWIARQVEFYRARGDGRGDGRGQQVEWKTYGYDEPADLGERLVAAGFVPQEAEVLMLGRAEHLVHDVDLPDGVRLRDIDSDEDWERVRVLMDAIWGVEATWINDLLREEQRARPQAMVVSVVEEAPDAADSAPGRVVSYGMLRLTPGTDFAGLWGGSTLPEWRGRGLYRALVAHRAARAIDLGHPLIRVDTSTDSRPILRGLGLIEVSTTTPYVLGP